MAGRTGALWDEKRTDDKPGIPAGEEHLNGPAWYEMNLSSLKAASAESAQTVPTRFDEQRAHRIDDMARDLAKVNGLRPDYYQLPIPGQPVGAAPVTNEAKYYADLHKRRLTDPTFQLDAGNSPQDFTKRQRDRFNADSRRRQREMAKQGWLGNLIGGVAGGFTDPVNIATLPFGIEGSIARRIVGEGLLNLGVEIFETPALMAERQRQGRPAMTPEEVLQDWTFAAVGGSAFTGAQIAGGKAIGAAWDAGGKAVGAAWNAVPENARASIAALPGDLKAAAAFRAMRPEEGWTPSERAALNVIERRGEIELSSPFHDDYQAVGAHVAKMDETLAAMAREPVPTSERVAAPEPQPAPRSARGSGAGLNGQILAGLKARGFTEAQARGIAAGIQAESRGDINARNPTSGAMGIGQWLGPRRKAIIARYGPNPTLDQQLDFLAWELRGGDAGGAKVLAQGDEAGVLRSYITDFMRPAQGAETTGDLARGMDALGRGGEAVPEATLADGEPLPPVRDAALDDVRPPIVMDLDGRPMGMGFFKPDEIDVDAGLMQFKSGGDEQGVISTLKGIEEWNPVAAGTITVWESLDGRRIVADGHQRLGLAKRLQAAGRGDDIQIPAYVLREADGFTAADARLETALVNVGQNTGTRIDAAKVFREGGDDPRHLRRMRSEGLAQEGKDLARLSNEAFGAVVNGVIPDSSGAIIGRLASDPETHMALVDLLAKTKPDNKRQAEAIVAQALDAGFARETQEELFGTRDVATALFAQKAKLLDKTLKELANLKGAFQVAARNAEALDAAGNRIDIDASIKAADGNALAQALVSKLAVRKGNPINDIFNAAAARVAAGEPVAKVVRDLVAELRNTDLAGALSIAERPSAEADPSGRNLLAELEDEGISREPEGLTPAERDELEAAGQGGFALFDEESAKPFDDPAGKGKQETAQSVWHDAEAAAKLEAAAAQARYDEQYTSPKTGEEAADLLWDQDPKPEDRAAFAAGWEAGRKGEAPPDWNKEAEFEGWYVGQRTREKLGESEPGIAREASRAGEAAAEAAKAKPTTEAVAALAGDIRTANELGEMTPEWEAHLDQVAAQAKQIADAGGTPLFHATAGDWHADNPTGLGMVFHAEKPLDAARYAGAGGGRRKVGDAGRVMVSELPPGAKLLDLTTPEGLAVLAGLPKQGRISGVIIGDAARDIAQGDAHRATNSFWAYTKRVAGSDAEGIKTHIVDALRQQGYSGIRFMDDTHPSIAVFDEAPATLDLGEAVDPNLAAKQAQELDIAAQQPLGGARKTGAAQEGAMPEGLFSGPEAPLFDLGDGKGPRALEHIDAELKAQEAGIQAARNCLL